MIDPPVYSAEELEVARLASITEFRRERMEEPLEDYLEAFDAYLGAAEDLLEATVDLQQLEQQALAILTDARLLEALRYLPGPPISKDDLKTLSSVSSLAPKTLRANPALVRAVMETVLIGLDRRRFPWVQEGREPDEGERKTAVLATAALMATRRVETKRRNEGKDVQEAKVEEALIAAGLTKVVTRVINTVADAPGRGEFCRESMLGNRKADLVVRLYDDRLMPIECKVSNSATNSVKRLNNDAAVKSEIWRTDFGARQVVPTAVLGGVYKLHNLEDAQRRGLALFWAHNLERMLDWVLGSRG